MDPADFYSGIVVDAYARLKSSTFDPEPYVRFVEWHGEPALEIGCGDGEPLLDLCAAGLDVDGVDSSADPDVELRYTPLSEVVDPQRRTRVTTARYERVTPAGVEVADREWLIHWHTPSGFHALCASAGLRVVSLVDDETGSPASEASTAFTATVAADPDR